jgi:DNA-binding PadR family transcriptional regulator
MTRDHWDFSAFFAGFDPASWRAWGPRAQHSGRRRRAQMFESGEVKFVILRLLREKPRHGYEIIKALEQSLHGWYVPSPGTIYPTLQLLEDQGLVRGVETDGRRVYHLTPEGERYLDEHKGVLEDIADRIRGAVHDVAGGPLGDLHAAFADVARATYPRIFRAGASHPAVPRIAEILRKAAADIEAAWQAATPADPGPATPGGAAGGPTPQG